MNRRDQTLRKARKSKSNDDWKSYKTLRNKCNKKIKKASQTITKKCTMITSINQRSFGSKLKTFFLKITINGKRIN